jgi:hypothetical protein
MKYKSPFNNITSVVSHIAAYDIIILSMTPLNDNYIIETSEEISQDEYEHLNMEYNFEKVLE